MVGPWYARDVEKFSDLSRSFATIETIILLTSWVVMRIWYFKKIIPFKLIIVFILNTWLIKISLKLWGEFTYRSLLVVEGSKNDDCLGNKNVTLNYSFTPWTKERTLNLKARCEQTMRIFYSCWTDSLNKRPQRYSTFLWKKERNIEPMSYKNY